jgi:hypothetical protein
MIDPALRDSLAGFDDTALAVLANPGLVRRAHRDLAEGKVRLVSSAPDRADVEADGQLVSITARGPRFADCACMSSAVCRHRIAAVLFLQSQASTDLGGEVVPPPDPANPEDVIVALDIAALERWAGKASWRAALELVGANCSVEPQANGIAVTIEGQDEAVLILRGQGFDGIVSKAAKGKRKALHAAAVLLARRHCGLPLPAAGDLSEQQADTAVPEIDAKFLALVEKALGEVVQLGFNLAPLPLEESLFEISVSSRADNLPRLAAILRTIAARIRLRRHRSLAFDPDELLELTATAFALIRALAVGSGDRQSALAGKVRRDFQTSPQLGLLGCGGERWRTIAGARGVTAWFVQIESGRWLSTTLARGPGQDPQFMPGQAWQYQSMWQTDSLAKLAHAHFELEGASISEDGRLSAPASAKATILQNGVAPSAELSVVIREWSELRSEFHRQAGLGLDAVPGPAPCLLAPSATASPYFDDLSQKLIWPIRDTQGAWLALTLDHEEPSSVAIEALEDQVRHSWNGLILARISRDRRGLVASPITLFGEGGPIDLTFWQKSHSKARPATGGWLARMRPHKSAQQFVRAPRDTTQSAIEAAWQYLIDRVEAGPGLFATLDGDRSAHAERLEAFGLPILAGLLRQINCSSSLLEAAFGLLVARQQRSSIPLLM